MSPRRRLSRFAHPLHMRRHEVLQRVAGDIRQAPRPQQRFDLLARPPAIERQPVADRRVFRAGAGVLALRRRRGVIVLRAVDDGEPPARPQHPQPSSIAASGCGKVHSTCRLITRSKLPVG